MRFLAITCRCGFDLATAEPTEVKWRGKGKDKEPYAECPAGCGRTYLLTNEAAAPEEPETEPETEPEAEPGEPTEPAEEEN